MDVKASSRPQLREDEIRLKDLVEEVWRLKWLVSALTLVFALGGLTAALVMPKMYKASVIVSPATNAPGTSMGGGVGSLVSQFGGLASLAGLSIASDSRKAESVAVLQSEALTERYIRQNNLLPILFPSLWDARANRWKDPRKVPTTWAAGQSFKKTRTVETDLRTGLVTMTINWTDPEVAARWANGLVAMTNDYLRGKAIDESNRDIAYLNEQAGRTDVVGVKEVIYSVLESEVNKAMLARGTDEYALKVVDPAIAPESPSSPRKKLWTLLGLFCGFVAAIFGIFVRMSWSRA